MDKNTRPTKELLENADTLKLCKMAGIYRYSRYHETFLQLLFALPLEIWSENNLDGEEVLRYLKPEEEEKLLKMYWASTDFKQHPLVALIMLKK